jgi:hypothetical protein
MKTIRIATILTALSALAAPAYADTGVAREALTQFRWTVSPGAYFPTGDGSAGFALSDHIGYGLNAGPLVISPGLSVPFYFVPENFTLAVLGEAQIHVPVSIISPYVVGGAGYGFATGAGTSGFSYRVGGGLMVYASKTLGIGAEATFGKLDSAELLQVVGAIHLEL